MKVCLFSKFFPRDLRTGLRLSRRRSDEQRNGKFLSQGPVKNVTGKVQKFLLTCRKDKNLPQEGSRSISLRCNFKVTRCNKPDYCFSGCSQLIASSNQFWLELDCEISKWQFLFFFFSNTVTSVEKGHRKLPPQIGIFCYSNKQPFFLKLFSRLFEIFWTILYDSVQMFTFNRRFKENLTKT